MPEFDLQIRGGTIVDGTRAPRVRGDLWIKDGRVAQIGGPPEYIHDNWDRLVGTAHHLATLRVESMS